jgi:hypothetical protein
MTRFARSADMVGILGFARFALSPLCTALLPLQFAVAALSLCRCLLPRAHTFPRFSGCGVLLVLLLLRYLCCFGGASGPALRFYRVSSLCCR